MKDTMIEMCECGDQFEVKGVNRRDYTFWKVHKANDIDIFKAFPKLNEEHGEQLILGLCKKCLDKQWGDNE